jgi:hypothetical protein
MLRPVLCEELDVGAVASFLNGEKQLVTHRVVGFERQGGDGGCYLFRGDAQEHVDRVPRGEVIYVVTRVEHPLLSYSTDGKLGQALAGLAITRPAQLRALGSGVRTMFRIRAATKRLEPLRRGRVELIVGALDLSWGANEWLTKQQRRLHNVLEGLTLTALDDSGQSALTIRRFDREAGYNPGASFDWEDRWFAASLPPPPARVLLGGAGSGREVAKLAALGYRVAAFDPAPHFARLGQALVAEGRCEAFLEGSYQQLWSDDPAGRAFRRRLDELAPFDAVILGWGSYTHVLSADDRRRTLRELDLRCPAGPILASYWAAAAGRDAAPGASHRLGMALGLLLGGSLPSAKERASRHLTHHGIAGHVFTGEELEELAASCGRRVELEPGRRPGDVAVFPHASFVRE